MQIKDFEMYEDPLELFMVARIVDFQITISTTTKKFSLVHIPFLGYGLDSSQVDRKSGHIDNHAK